MLNKRLVKLGVLPLVAAVCIFAGARLAPSSDCDIWIDASRPLTLVPPFDVVEIGENAERGLWIGPEEGRGWKGEAGGEATYRFYVPADGKYEVWAYALWHDECTNAMYAQIDDMDRAIVGNDPLFNKWHWVRGFRIDLAEGVHMLKLSNHSDNLAVQKLYLTNVAGKHPTGELAALTDVFFEGFDGCDEGNFVLWESHGGQWKVFHPETESYLGKKILSGKSDKPAMLMLRLEKWDEYLLNASVRTVRAGVGGSAGICFALKDADNHHQVRWTELSGGEAARLELVQVRGGEAKVLGEFEVPWRGGKWHELEMAIRPAGIAIGIDGGEKRFLPLDDTITKSGNTSGGIGLWLGGQMEAEFDNIHVRTFGAGGVGK